MKDVFAGKKFNAKLAKSLPGGGWKLRVRHVSAKGKRSPHLKIRCGCCKNAVEVYYGEGGLEINGVNAPVSEWRKLLLPLLR